MLQKFVRLQAKQDLIKICSEINTLEEDLKPLVLKYNDTVKERHILQEEMDVMQRCLIAADKLICGLKSQNVR
jgi:hypothetical protein